jgi:hypothetical protein
MAPLRSSTNMGQWQADGVRIPGSHTILSTDQAKRLIRKAMQEIQPEFQSQVRAFLVHGFEEPPSLVCKRVLAERIAIILDDPDMREEVLAR